MRAKPQRTQNWQEMRIAWRFSLRFSTPARYARLRGKAQREALSCPCGTEGRSERERTPRNHIQRTYKGCEARAALGRPCRSLLNPERVAQTARAAWPCKIQTRPASSHRDDQSAAIWQQTTTAVWPNPVQFHLTSPVRPFDPQTTKIAPYDASAAQTLSPFSAANPPAKAVVRL